MSGNAPFLRTLACALLLLAGLCGCATVDQTIPLNYAPLERPFGRQNGEVIISRVDSRPSQRNSRGEWVIGSLNNVHGVRQADLVANRSLGEWISDALVLELKHSGYSVSSAPQLPPNTARGIRISAITATLNINRDIFTSTVKQELRFNVELYLNGALAKSFTVGSRSSRTTALKASSEEVGQLVLQSMQDAMQQVMAEANALYDGK